MIRVHIPTGLPTDGGKLEFRTLEVEFRAGASIADYLRELEISPDLVSHVIYNGGSLSPEKTIRYRTKPKGFWRRVLRTGPAKIAVLQSDLETAIPRDGDEFHVLPAVAGKNAAVVLGVAGAIIGLYTANWALTAKSLQYAMWGYAIGSTVGAFIASRGVRNVQPGDDGPTSHTWNGVENEDREGVPVPVVMGKNKTGIVRVGMFRRRNQMGTGETLHILGIVSVGPVQSITDIRINNQPYTNFPGVSFDVRKGGSDNESLGPMRGFSGVANTIPLSVELDLAGYVHSTRPNFPVDAMEILLDIPALFHTTSKNEQRDNETFWRYRYRVKGGAYGAWITTGQSRKAATRSRVLPTIRIDANYDGSPLTRGEYDVEIQWVSATFTDVTMDAWKVYLSGVTEELDEKRTYPGYAMLAVRAIASQDLGVGLPTISCVCEGLLLDRWTGTVFDPPAYVSGGEEIGRNPAWAVLKILRDRSILNATYDPAITDPADTRSRRYSYEAWGLGDWIKDDQIDLASFKVLADRAKELVTVRRQLKDANGATYEEEYQEPRCLLDIVLNQEQGALETIRGLLASCRAHLSWAGDKWRVVTEMPKAPTQLFTMGNIIKNSFSITYDADRSVNSIIPQFIDAERDFEFSTHAAVDGPGVKLYGQPRRSESQQFLGITRRSQVIREAIYSLNKRWYIRRFITFIAGASGVLAEPGDLINIQHDIPQWGFGGCALPGSTASYVELGQAITLETGKSYQITVRPQDGSDDDGNTWSRTISDPAGTYQGVNVTTPFPATVQENDVWWLGEVSPQPATIVAIEETDGDEDHRQIAAIEYNASIESDSETIVIPALSNLPRFQSPPPPITDASAREIVSSRLDGRWSSTILVQWTPPPPAANYGIYKHANVEISFDGGTSYQAAPNGQGLHDRYEIADAEGGTTFYFRITPVSTREIANRAGAKVVSCTTSGKTSAPPTPLNLTATVSDGVFLFDWDAVLIDDLQREIEYEIRTANPTNWKTDLTGLLWRGKVTKYELDEPAQRSYTVYLRAVDKFSNYSTGAATATITDAAPAAPAIVSITRFKNALKVKVGAAPDVDALRIYLHASQINGFTPSDATRVAQTLGPKGGEFVYQIDQSGTWYFKVTVADWLTETLNDWIYSSQASQSILIILPVNPTGVTANVVDSPGPMGGVQNGDGTVRPVGLKDAQIGWTFSDVVNPANSLLGFDVLIYLDADGVAKPIMERFVSDTNMTAGARAYTFSDFIPPTDGSFRAAVKALYIDGLTSNLVTSTGQTITVATNPNLRDSDDRNVTRLAESFDAIGLPTGFSIPTGTGTVLGGGLVSITTVAGGAQLNWDLNAYRAAYLDLPNVIIDDASIILRVVFIKNGGAYSLANKPYIQIGASTFYLDPVFTDDAYHTYRVPLNISVNTATAIVSLVVPGAFMNSGSAVAITSIAVATESLDESLDGWIDRAGRARDQMGRDPNGGFFWQQPVRIGDDDNNFTLVDRNGIFWLSNSDGTETPYKRARRAILRAVTSNTVLSFNDGTYFDPPIPTPVATNKFRTIIQRVHNATVDAAPTTTYPKRWYIEATELSTSGFRLVAIGAHGGALTTQRKTAPAGDGWTAANGHKSLMTLGTAAGGTNNGDAWFHPASATDDSAVAFAASSHVRSVLWLAADMPLVKKANGSYYAVDLWFMIYHDNYTPATLNPFAWSAGFTTSGPVKMRCYTDGRRHRMPWVYGNVGTSPVPARSFKIDWYQQTIESGGGAPCNPTRVLLDAFEQRCLTSPPSPIEQGAAMLAYDMDIITLEEF